jgi:hypothetical protein
LLGLTAPPPLLPLPLLPLLLPLLLLLLHTSEPPCRTATAASASLAGLSSPAAGPGRCAGSARRDSWPLSDSRRVKSSLPAAPCCPCSSTWPVAAW